MGDQIQIDEVMYDLDSLSDKAKTAIQCLQFSEERLKELSNMKALLQRARNSYVDSLRQEVLSNKAGLLLDDN